MASRAEGDTGYFKGEVKLNDAIWAHHEVPLNYDALDGEKKAPVDQRARIPKVQGVLHQQDGEGLGNLGFVRLRSTQSSP